MFSRSNILLGVILAAHAASAPATRAADSFSVDPAHSSITFMIPHLGISYVHGRFNEFSGKVTLDKDDPAKSAFELTIKIDSVDTNQKKRDEHLRSPDFFNAKQFPVLTFQSTSVKATADGYEVTGDVDFHGVKKPITFTLKGGKMVEFPKGKQCTGFTSGFQFKRSEFGMDKFLEMIGEDVHVAIGLEVVKQ